MLNIPPKLEAVLIRLCKITNLNITQAVKLPYLVDVTANNILGKPITEGHHEAWMYGVVTAEAWRHLDRANEDLSSPFRLEQEPFSDEKSVRVKPGTEATGLTDAEERIVTLIAAEYSAVWAKDLGIMTKLMNPQIAIWGSNESADLGPDAFERMSPEYQEMARDVASTTLDYLRRHSKPVETIEEMLA